MRFGVCTDIPSASLLAREGYDYIELAVAGDLLPESSESDWAVKRKQIEAMPLRPEVFNSFVRSARIVGPEANSARLRNYVGRALSRAAQVGGRIIVFGSGGARSIPDGWPAEAAHRQMTEFLNCCADESVRTGVVVAIEPLCKAECNFINLVSEGAALSREIGSPGVMNLADTYHMEADGEPLSAILESADVLAHTHTADTNRYAPGTGIYDHADLFSILKQAGYDGRLSIECGWQNRFDELVGPALEHLKMANDRAQGSEA